MKSDRMGTVFKNLVNAADWPIMHSMAGFLFVSGKSQGWMSGDRVSELKIFSRPVGTYQRQA